ncbi:MAG: glutamate synthase [Peptococcaceae bacterium]|nr:glutamate synthase [Peptococcaceae bacterium]
MNVVSAKNLNFQELNERIRRAAGDLSVEDCYGQRYIGNGLSGRTLTVHGTPGNCLGAFLNGATIIVHGNAQDAIANTMNDGKIIIHGNAGDTLGYGMRGGTVYVKGNAGYRTGIHMKQYLDKKPVVVVGGRTGCFLGEYQAGGLIIVLGLGECEENNQLPIDDFTGTGIHGGSILIRTRIQPKNLPIQVAAAKATKVEIKEITPYLQEFAGYFDLDVQSLVDSEYYCLTPNASNPYHQLYTPN